MKHEMLRVGVLAIAISASLLSYSQESRPDHRRMGQGERERVQHYAPRLDGDRLIYNNKRPGGLKDAFNSDIQKRVRRLIIEGPINKDDVNVIKKIGNRSRCEDDRGKSINNYLDLDLSRATIEKTYGMDRDFTYDGMFSYVSHLRSVRLPIRLKGLGERTFASCYELDRVDMPQGLRYIGDGAFKDCDNLEFIDLPNSVEEIGKACFSGCKKLRRVTLPPSLRALKSEAFKRCPLEELNIPYGLQTMGNDCLSQTNLREIFIPRDTHVDGTPGNGSYLERIVVEDGNKELMSHNGVLYSYDGSILLEMPANKSGSYTLLDNVIEIKKYAFYESKLSQIILPEGLVKIGEHAFFACMNLTNIKLPSTVTELGSHAFALCRSLTNISLSSSLLQMGAYSFENCNSLNGITIPEGVNNIPKKCFHKCESLTFVNLPGHLNKIEEEAFKDCKNLTQINLPNSLKEIESYAFESCENLEGIRIPASVTKIGKKPFHKCKGLKKITCESSVPPELKSNGSEKVLLAVPAGSAATYKKTSQWKKFKSIEEY